jgi:hypothetical protein
MPTSARRFVPSPALVIGGLALVVALGGTSYAVTATVVNIADPSHPSHRVHVNAAGALNTYGTAAVHGAVAPQAPQTPLWAQFYLSAGVANMAIGPTKAVIALNRIVVDNYFGQTNGDTAQVHVYESGGSTTACDGSTGSRQLGVYDVRAGSTVTDTMPTPIVLRPFAKGHVWCLSVTASIQGAPSSYFLPELEWSGFLVAGTAPPHTASGHALRARQRSTPPRVSR